MALTWKWFAFVENPYQVIAILWLNILKIKSKYYILSKLHKYLTI